MDEIARAGGMGEGQRGARVAKAGVRLAGALRRFGFESAAAFCEARGIFARPSVRPSVRRAVTRRRFSVLHSRSLQGRSIRVNVGVEFKGVSWS
eukprot:31427-Pelagococcus_subviridis.AAC.9